MIDVVFPNKNEEEFAEIAKKLGISGLIFVYKSPAEFCQKKLGIQYTNALLVEPRNMQKAKNAHALAICTASREAIERGASIVFGFEQNENKEHTHFRSSGLNQVLCKIAKEKGVAIGFSFSSILTSFGQKRAILIGRMTQNITFCKKYKTPIWLASFATEPWQMRAQAEIESFFKQIGFTA